MASGGSARGNPVDFAPGAPPQTCNFPRLQVRRVHYSTRFCRRRPCVRWKARSARHGVLPRQRAAPVLITRWESAAAVSLRRAFGGGGRGQPARRRREGALRVLLRGHRGGGAAAGAEARGREI